MIDNKYIESIINEYFKRENIFTIHQIDSYNDLIDIILPKILSQSFPISINFKNDTINNVCVDISNIKIERPYYTENNGCSKIMTPNIARLRNYTYSLSVIIDIGVNYSTYEDNIKVVSSTKYIKNIILCKIPIVVKSKYCVYKDNIFSKSVNLISGENQIVIHVETNTGKKYNFKFILIAP